MIKRFSTLILFVVLLALCTWAQQPQGIQNYTASTAVRNPISVSQFGTGISFHKITWITSGTVSSCVAELDSAPDNITWSSLIAVPDCHISGSSVVTAGTFAFISINPTTLTGGGSVTFTWDGYINNPVNSSGGVSGQVAGQDTIGLTASTVGASPAFTHISALTGPTTNDYCDKVNQAFINNPQGAIVLGDIIGNVHCTAATAAAMLSNCTNGYLRGQNTQVWVDVVAGSTPVIPIPNKCGGIRGIGRADIGGAGFSINACSAAGVGGGNAACLAPTVRAAAITSMTPAGKYVHIVYGTPTAGPPLVGGELAQVSGVKDSISLVAGSGNLVIAGSAGAQTVTFNPTAAQTFAILDTVILENLNGTQGSKLNGMACLLTAATATSFACNLVNTPNRQVVNATETPSTGIANHVNNAMYRVCQLSSKNYGSASAYTLSAANAFVATGGSGTPTFNIGEMVVLTKFTGADAFLNGQYVSITAVGVGTYSATTYFAHGATSGGGGSVGTAPVQIDSAGPCPANPTATDAYVVNPLATTTGAIGTIRAGTGFVGMGTSIGPAGTFGFAQRIEDLHVDCKGVEGLSGLVNYAGEEQSGWSHTVVNNCPFAGWDIHTNFAQNSGPYVSNEIYDNADNCHEGTINAFIADSGIAGLQKITYSAAGCGAGGGVTPEPYIGLLLDGGFLELRGQVHCEGVLTCIELGQDIQTIGLAISTVGSQPVALPGNTGLDISGNFCSAGTSDIVLEVVKLNTGAYNTMVDHCQPDGTLFNSDNQFAFYTWDINATLENRITTSTTSTNLFEGGLAYFRPVSPKIASYPVALYDSDTILTNEGAAGAITFTMPVCNLVNTGAHYYFEVDAAQQMIVSMTQKFRMGGFLSGAGPNITGATQGSRLGLQCLHSTVDAVFEWLVTDLAPNGAWTIGAGPLLGSGAAGVPGSVALAVGAVANGTCNTATATVEGVVATSVINWSFSSAPGGVTGYGFTTPLKLDLWPSGTNTVTISQCNSTASPITPGAISVNIKVLP